MKITALMENTAASEDYCTEHGLSLYVELGDKRLLFDAGQTDAYLRNAERLGIDLSLVDLAVLSHGHYDHGGGLNAFLRINRHAPVYVSQYAFDPCYDNREHSIGIPPELAGHPQLRRVGESLRLDDSMEICACNEKTRPFPMGAYGLETLREGILMPDDFRHEQYLLLREGDRRVLLSGCSHKGVLNIIHWFQPDVMIGGFHFMDINPEGREQSVLEDAARELLSHPTLYYTCHCTGLAQYAFLKERMGERLRYLSTGQQIEC